MSHAHRPGAGRGATPASEADDATAVATVKPARDDPTSAMGTSERRETTEAR